MRRPSSFQSLTSLPWRRLALAAMPAISNRRRTGTPPAGWEARTAPGSAARTCCARTRRRTPPPREESRKSHHRPLPGEDQQHDHGDRRQVVHNECAQHLQRRRPRPEHVQREQAGEKDDQDRSHPRRPMDDLRQGWANFTQPAVLAPGDSQHVDRPIQQHQRDRQDQSVEQHHPPLSRRGSADHSA